MFFKNQTSEAGQNISPPEATNRLPEGFLFTFDTTGQSANAAAQAEVSGLASYKSNATPVTLRR
jgi:hypothetical protein